MGIPKWAKGLLDQWQPYGMAIKPSAQDVRDYLDGAAEIFAHVAGMAQDADWLLPRLLKMHLKGKTDRSIIENAPHVEHYVWPEFDEWYVKESATRRLRKPKPYHLAEHLIHLFSNRAAQQRQPLPDQRKRPGTTAGAAMRSCRLKRP